MVKLLDTVVLTLTVLAGAHASDYYWRTSVVGAGSEFMNLNWWRDADGNRPDAAPTNITDTISIEMDTETGKVPLNNAAHPYNADYFIWFPVAGRGSASFTHNIEFDSIGSTAMFHPLMKFSTLTDGSQGISQTVSVANPDEFGGIWYSDNGCGQLTLRATPSHSPFVKYFDTYGYMAINVPDAGTSATVGKLFRPGSLLKSGEGDLTVKEAAGWDSRIYVGGGTLTLNGVSSADFVPALPSGTRMHLDASREDTFDTFNETYGNGETRKCIWRWRDADGGSIVAVTNAPRNTAPGTIPYSRAPYVSPVKSGTDLPLVDFGSPNTCATDASPSNCWLRLIPDCSGVREIFYVAEHTVPAGDASANSGSILGGFNEYNLVGWGRYRIFTRDACLAAKQAEITVNGAPATTARVFPTRYNGDNLGAFCVVGISFPSEVSFSAIASGRNTPSATGGYRVGEIVAYSRALTEDERHCAVRYLMNKWQKQYRPDDVGDVVLCGNTAAISVPEGRVARVRNLSSQRGKIVKKGGGTLIVDGMAPAGIPVEVDGGELLVEAPSVPTNAPAANPMIWLDATATSSFVFQSEGSANITRWNDRRPEVTSYYAEIPADDAGTTYHTFSGSAGRYPAVKQSATPTGLPAVDFGTYNQGSWMWLQPRGEVDSYCGFIVQKIKNHQAHNVPFGVSQAYLTSGIPDRLFGLPRYFSMSINAKWAINGKTLDPWFQDEAGTYASTEYRVVSFSESLGKIRADCLVKYDPTQGNYVGNQEIAELLLYDRPLSAEEVRQTEAYLMAKWQGKAHPESAEGAFVGSYEFASDADAVIDVGSASFTVTNLQGSTGAFVKRGEGTLSLEHFEAATNITSIVVAAGDATLHFAPVCDDPIFRYDASDLSSFTETYVTSGENGTLVTNLLKWTDQVSGRVAKSAIYGTGPNGYIYQGTSGGAATNPTLVMATMPDGKLRPAVDFGEFAAGANIYDITDQSNAFQTNFNCTSSGFRIDTAGLPDAEEAHVIVADEKSQSGAFFSSWYGTHYIRQAAKLFNTDYFHGTAWLDGVLSANPKTENFSQHVFHLVSIQLDSHSAINGIGMDRGYCAGGNRICEYMAYKEKNSDLVREYIQHSLMTKWLGAERQEWYKPLSGIEVAPESTLVLDTDTRVNVSRLSGGGTVVAPELHGISDIYIVSPESGLNVSGKVELLAQGTVHVETISRLISPGSYPLLTAGELVFAANGGIEGWVLDAKIPSRFRGGLVIKDNSISLRLAYAGTVLNFR